jgi:hypothetical protein
MSGPIPVDITLILLPLNLFGFEFSLSGKFNAVKELCDFPHDFDRPKMMLCAICSGFKLSGTHFHPDLILILMIVSYVFMFCHKGAK